MGIKFRCPNGHKLNVKAFLGGKRGICPKCGARFEIPLESGGQVAAVEIQDKRQETGDLLSGTSVREEVPVSGRGRTVPPNVTPAARDLPPNTPERPQSAPPAGADTPSTAEAASPAPPAPLPADPLADAPHASWYVRPTSGGQFGPATSHVMRQWIDEGRVAADSLVWRDGWAEWRTAKDVFPDLTSWGDVFSHLEAKPANPAPSVSTERTAPRRSKNRSMAKLSLFLIAVVVFLAAVLIFVVVWNK